MLCFLDNTGEALAAVLRPGNTAADHITVLDQALAQIPDAHRHGTPILIRADSAGGAKAFLHHIRTLHSRGILTYFSVGTPSPSRSAARSVPCPSRSGIPHSNRTAPYVGAQKSPS